MDEFKKLKDLVNKFEDEVLKIIEIKKYDKDINKLEEEYNKLYKEKINLINEKNKNVYHKIYIEKELLNSVYESVDPEIKKDIQSKEDFLKSDLNNYNLLRNLFITKNGI